MSQFNEEFPATELIEDSISAENQFQSFVDETVQFPFTYTEEIAATGLMEAPISTENQVGLILEEATSHIQGQNLAPRRCYNSFTQTLNENSPMIQGLDTLNEYNTSSQILKPNIMGNNTLSDINHQSSSNQMNPAVQERGRIDMRVPNNQIMTSESFTLPPFQNDQIVNSHNEWNSGWPENNRFSSVGVNDSQYNPNYKQYTEIYNQVVDSVQLSRPEQSMSIQMHQVAPANANKVTIQPDKTTIAESSFIRAPPNSIINNHNATPMVLSIGPSNVIFPQQNQRLNLQIGRGQQEQPWENRQLQIGQSSSSKDQEINNLPLGQRVDIGLALRQPNNALENARIQNLGNNINVNPYLEQNQYSSNALYDSLFEICGHAVDPHIRMFLQSTDPEIQRYLKFD
ncbi:uncharacterized protein LOC109815735 [Cajanus cajan]|uniref:uncharacterized protein LOC109815735 n=1 Tax=Cajanus cajan TaxID=3821 RepID=UPI0010FB2E7D|nr:uncharacterized protein LOC109815735 [Cajanus cajan]